jgi:hypothetical protein
MVSQVEKEERVLTAFLPVRTRFLRPRMRFTSVDLPEFARPWQLGISEDQRRRQSDISHQ